ncbi:alpha/beta hydrolase family protein [Phycisphaera mikurensis]|uniref:Serine aminopeptidase S33 domain-containing protein n=1 Tax=Phycisphaera mikurensis (strain NBRC 102666 / KCTC 22515 / FYK2301M01) TaxID=1142394 RepID=I0IAX5_PHYMF|nr:alpha/beta hydrolase [Phycisphaera mikurensis]MBB6442613.1 pimeloyl-ACP methyl ester carboxylesterase [Phycisphaera mikurensis]BAM02413.1 hypothetical protein PSMK_02540 [Phycisphaera mikurensis NBRC 102666]
MPSAPLTSHRVPGACGLPILADARTPEKGTARATVLLGHGFKGYKEYGFLPRLGEVLAGAGFATVAFNFSHAGMTRPEGPFTREDLFALDTWNKQVADWHALLQAVRSGRIPGVPADRPVAFFGHSRGGLSALLAAARLAGDARPAAVVAAAAPADASRLSDADAATLRAGHAIESPSGRTGQTLRVLPSWLLEQDADPEGHDPVRAATTLGAAGVPLLVIHGTEDATVNPGDATRLAGAAGAAPVLVEGADHVFGAPNPMPRSVAASDATRRLFEETLRFLGSLAGTPR